MKNFSHRFWLKLVWLLAVTQQVLCQTGYNYGQSLGGAANLASTQQLANQIRPVVATNSVAALPTAPTAFGGTTASGSLGTTAYGGFVGQPARPTIPTAPGFIPTAAATNIGQQQQQQPTGSGFGGVLNTAGAGLAQRTQTRPSLRPAQGIYAGNAQPNQAQFQANQARIGGAQTPTGLDSDYDGDYSAIPGVPGVDYPIYSQVPQTSFDCSQQPLPGYYSDIEAQCQVFHICALNRTYSFLCPNGTIFSQEVLVCVWWNQYECATAPSLYANNAYIYDYGERTPTPTNTGGYQGQLSTASQQGRGQIPNTIGSSARAAVAQPGTAGIYNAGNLRPTNAQLPIQNPGFAGVDGFGGNLAAAGAVLPAGNIGQAFPRTSNQLNPATQVVAQGAQGFGAVLRASNTRPTGAGGGNVATNLNYNGLQEKPQTTGNREYLPPRRP